MDNARWQRIHGENKKRRDRNNQLTVSTKEKKITIIFHIGFGKTGTSLLQKNVFPHLENTLYLGKLPDDNLLSPELQKGFYQLFYPYFFRPHYKNQFSRLGVSAIPFFGNAVIKEIKKHSKSLILFSHEAVLDSWYSIIDYNLFLLKGLVQYLEQQLDAKTTYKVFFVIRNQKDILLSSYAYAYGFLKKRFPSFEHFLKFGLENPYAHAFGGYHYDVILELLFQLFGQQNVRCYLFEMMFAEKERFFNGLLSFIGVSQSASDFNIHEKINVNSEGNRHFLLENINTLPFPIKFTIRAKSLFLRARNRKVWSFPKETPNNKVVVGEIIGFPRRFRKAFDTLYAESNARLSTMLSIDLSQYNYACAKQGKKSVQDRV